MIQCTQIYVNAFIWNALAVSESDHAGGSCLRCQPRDNGSGLSDQPWKNDYCSLRKIRLIKRSVNVAPSTPWSPFVIVRTGRFAAIVRKFDDRAVWREWYFRTEPWRGIYILTRSGWKKDSPLPFLVSSISSLFWKLCRSVNTHDNSQFFIVQSAEAYPNFNAKEYWFRI